MQKEPHKFQASRDYKYGEIPPQDTFSKVTPPERTKERSQDALASLCKTGWLEFMTSCWSFEKWGCTRS